MQNKPNLLDALMNVTSFYTVDYENIANCKLGENKPNLPNAQMNVSSILTKDYENQPLRGLPENKPNSNPIKPDIAQWIFGVTVVVISLPSRTLHFEELLKRWFARDIGSCFSMVKNLACAECLVSIQHEVARKRDCVRHHFGPGMVVVVHPAIAWSDAGHDGRSRWAACRGGAVSPAKEHAPLSQANQVGCLDWVFGVE